MYSSTAQLNWQRRTGRLEARLTALYPLSYRWAASGRCWGPLWLRRERGDGGLKRCRGSRGEDVSSRREDRSGGESGDGAARGAGRTSPTRQVHAGQKRKDFSCDPFSSSTWRSLSHLHPRKDGCIFSPARREREKEPPQVVSREEEFWSYLVRESVLEAGWWWVCLTAPLGRNKVNSSHSRSLQEVKWKTTLRYIFFFFTIFQYILEKQAEEEEEEGEKEEEKKNCSTSLPLIWLHLWINWK